MLSNVLKVTQPGGGIWTLAVWLQSMCYYIHYTMQPIIIITMNTFT